MYYFVLFKFENVCYIVFEHKQTNSYSYMSFSIMRR